MKIKPEHYEHMKQEIEPLAKLIPEHRAYLVNEGKAKDIEKRLRWDLFYAAKLTRYACDTLYSYMHDDHIDTALKGIMKELGVAK